MIDLREQVEELVIEGAIRPAGTEEEQNAALAMEERFQMLGLDTSVDEFSCQGSLPLTKLLYCALAFLAGLLGFLLPNGAILCIVLAALALVLFLTDSLGLNFLDQLVGRGISQNVVGRYVPDDDEYHRLVVVMAHYDTARPEPQGAPFLANYHALVKWILMISMLLIVICGVGSLFGLPFIVSKIIKIVGAVAGLVPLAALAFTLIRNIMPYSESANDNTSGMAVMLGVADQLVASGGQSRSSGSTRGSRRAEAAASAGNAGTTGDIMGRSAADTMGIAIDEDGNPDWRGIKTRVRKRSETLAQDAALEEEMDGAGSDLGQQGLPSGGSSWTDRIIANRQAAQEAKEQGMVLDNESIIGADGTVQYGTKLDDPRVSSRLPQEAGLQVGDEAPADLAPEQPAEQPAQAVEEEKSGLPSWWTSTAKKRESSEEKDVKDIKGRSKFADLPSGREGGIRGDGADAPAEGSQDTSGDAAGVAAADAAAAGAADVVETTGMATAFVQGASGDAPGAAAIDPEDTYVPASSIEDISSRLEYLKANPLANLHATQERKETEAAQPVPAGPVVDHDLEAILFSVEAEEAGISLDTQAAARALESLDSAESFDDAFEKFVSDPSILSAVDIDGDEDADGAAEEGSQGQGLGTLPSLGDEDAPVDAVARQRLVDLPTIGGFGADGFSGHQAGFDDTQYKEGDFEDYYDSTGSFQSLGATMAFGALDDSAFADVAEDELYIQDADDSSFDPTAGYNDFVPAEADLPKSRRSLFGRKRKDKKGRNKGYDQSASEWLNLEEDFDARQAGADIGSWENFGDDANEWQGGAFGGDSFEDDAAFIRAASDDLMDKEIWFVALGSSNLNHAGIKALFSRYGEDLRDATFINLECVGAGDLCFIESEGDLLKRKTSETALQIADGVCENLGMDIPFESLKWLTTDAYEATKKGIPALTIMGLNDKNMPVGWHWKTDSRDIIDDQTLQDASDILMEALKLS